MLHLKQREKSTIDVGYIGSLCSLIPDQFSLPLQEDGLSPREQELKDLKESLQDTQPVGVLVDGCRTMDQVRSSSNKHFIMTLFLRT